MHGICLTIALCHRGLCRDRVLEYDRGPCGHHLRLSAGHSCLNASSMSDPVWRHYSRSFQAERDSVGESCFQRRGKYSQSFKPQWLVRRKVCAVGGLGTSPKRHRSSSMTQTLSCLHSFFPFVKTYRSYIPRVRFRKTPLTSASALFYLQNTSIFIIISVGY